MAAPTLNNDTPDSEAQNNKSRNKKSMVWMHFYLVTVNADITRAICNHCNKSFAYITKEKLAGTSHLKRHIALGICPVYGRNQEKKQLTYSPTSHSGDSMNATVRQRKRFRATPGFASIAIDQDHYCSDIAKMIIQHDYPLQMVEQPGFIAFARALHPEFIPVSLDTIQERIMSIYLREKQGLLNLLELIPGRVSLALDFRSSNQSTAYILVTGYFVDYDWKLQRRILNVIMLPVPDSEVALNNAVNACISDWFLDNKLFTITVDQSFANETAKPQLRGSLSIKNPLVLNGQLLIGSCYACVLSHLAQDALRSMSEAVEKVRQSVKYVKASVAHEVKFLELKQQLQVPTSKTLFLDDQTKWDTTYQMLVAASELKEVFSCLDTSDPDYAATPSMDEWKQVESLCSQLRTLFQAANILCNPICPTSNVFFHEVWKIQLELMQAAMSRDPFTSNWVKPLQQKFDGYWKGCYLVLAIAVVMDPRFKMRLVEFAFSKIYAEDAESWIRVVDEGLHELYLEYVVLSLPAPTFVEEGNEMLGRTEISHEESLLSTAEDLSDFDVYLSEIIDNQPMRSELDQYLEEALLPRVQDFDALDWWRKNREQFPTLSKMASDVLSIPVATVLQESVFDTTKRTLDSYRSSLGPTTLQALVCSKDWLQYGFSEIYHEISGTIVKTEC